MVNQMPATYAENFLFQVDATRKNTAATLGESVIAELNSVISFLMQTGKYRGITIG